jgi:hypothetical protein
MAQPNGVDDIGLAARHSLGIARIHEDQIEPMAFENFESWYPTDPGGFHRHAGDAARFEPARQIMQILRECVKHAHPRVTGIGIDCRPRVDHRHVQMAADYYLCHANSSVQERGRGPGKSVTFLTGIVAEASPPFSSAEQPM